MFTPLHSSTNQELFEKYGKVAAMWKYVTRPSYRLKLKYPLPFSVSLTRYTAVQIKNCLKSTSAIKVATMKNTDDFRYAKEAITCNYQINAFHCQQR